MASCTRPWSASTAMARKAASISAPADAAGMPAGEGRDADGDGAAARAPAACDGVDIWLCIRAGICVGTDVDMRADAWADAWTGT